jgi:hypothetical protein
MKAARAAKAKKRKRPKKIDLAAKGRSFFEAIRKQTKGEL